MKQDDSEPKRPCPDLVEYVLLAIIVLLLTIVGSGVISGGDFSLPGNSINATR